MDSDGDGYSDEVENRYDWNASLADQQLEEELARLVPKPLG